MLAAHPRSLWVFPFAFPQDRPDISLGYTEFFSNLPVSLLALLPPDCSGVFEGQLGRLGAPHVRRVVYGFKVVRVDAGPVPTEVV